MNVFYSRNKPESDRHNSSFHSRSLAMKLFLCNFSVEGGGLSGGALCQSPHVAPWSPAARPLNTNFISRLIISPLNAPHSTKYDLLSQILSSPT